ncbi:MAG: hypothetical protein Q4C65_15045, partial [Eubacteriales bacterium]|nr:hypothetical protein [Eubacteriales bacterium]
MRKHYEKILEGTDSRVKKCLRVQVTDQNSPYCGGFPDENDLIQVKYTVYRLTTMTAAYSNRESRYYHNAKVAERILLGYDFVERFQHEDGLFDYINCNFHSAPDTAFIVKRMLPGLHYLRGTKRDEAQEKIYARVYGITKKAAEGLLLGGFHTPNHRWAIASNLLECADFFGEKRLAEAAEVYLREGSDCNGDGEYAERSAGGYNRINNEAMLTMAKYTGDVSYEDCAVRNLRMMLTYMEPDGTVFTANSTRQDNGKRIVPKNYYWDYLMVGRDRNIPEFLAFANYLFELTEENRLSYPDILWHFMNRPELIGEEYDGKYEFHDFKKLYRDSGIARVRRGETTYTLMQGKSNFLYFSNRSIDVSVKIAGAFCEHRAFCPELLEETEDGFHVKQVMRGWYYLPFSEKPATSDWWKMDNASREKKLGPNLTVEAWVKEIAGGLEVSTKISGVSQAPFRVELSVLGAQKADNEHFCMHDIKGKRLLSKSGMTVFTNRDDAVEA